MPKRISIRDNRSSTSLENAVRVIPSMTHSTMSVDNLSSGKEPIRKNFEPVVNWMNKYAPLLRKRNGEINQTNIAEHFQVSKGAVTDFKKNGVPIKSILSFSIRNNASLDELFEIPKDRSEAEIFMPYIEVKKRDEIMNTQIELLRTWALSQFQDLKKLKIFIAQTASMTPLINKNDLLIIDTSEKTIGESGIYAVDRNGSLLIRQYICRSDGTADEIQLGAQDTIKLVHDQTKSLTVQGKVVKILKDI